MTGLCSARKLGEAISSVVFRMTLQGRGRTLSSASRRGVVKGSAEILNLQHQIFRPSGRLR